MQAVLLSSDLMMMSTAQGAADRHGVALVSAGGVEEAVASSGEDGTRLVVIDLRLSGLDVADCVARVRSAKPQAAVVACGPHVHTQSLEAAEAAGCDAVFTRGEFERRIDGLLAAITGPADAEEPARP
jgi:ActR/RegA family two-component response regulator